MTVSAAQQQNSFWFPSLHLDTSRGTIAYGSDPSRKLVVLLDASVGTGSCLLLSQPLADIVAEQDLWSSGIGTSVVPTPTGSPGTLSRARRRRSSSMATNEKLAWIRSALSLKVSEAASIFHVERPTIYAWLAGETRPQPANQVRIDRIFNLARQWGILSPRPLGDAVRVVDDEASILDLLREEEIPVQRIADRFDAIAHRPLQRKYGEGERRLAGERVKKVAANRGLDVSAVQVDEATIDAQTGRRTARDE